jgi:diguanylate cyclase (GGDEF)-like protein
VTDDRAIRRMLTGAGVLVLIGRLVTTSGALGEQRRLAEKLAELTAQLEHRSLHDPLTGLANRVLFATELDRAWGHHRQHGGGVTVMAIDLDGFKAINDRHGHHVGDDVLAEAALRLSRCVRATDTLARLGGDEFTIVLPATTVAEAEVVADRIHAELARPLAPAQDRGELAASIGIAGLNERHEIPHDLLREADTALYAAKAAGKRRSLVYRVGLERATHVSVDGIVPVDARAWAAYMRQLRDDIAGRKLSGSIPGRARAPEVVHRTFQGVLAAIDGLEGDGDAATLVLPARCDLEEFVFHQTAVQHWADAMVARGDLTVRRPSEADRFWAQLERSCATPG